MSHPLHYPKRDPGEAAGSIKKKLLLEQRYRTILTAIIKADGSVIATMQWQEQFEFSRATCAEILNNLHSYGLISRHRGRTRISEISITLVGRQWLADHPVAPSARRQRKNSPKRSAAENYAIILRALPPVGESRYLSYLSASKELGLGVTATGQVLKGLKNHGWIMCSPTHLMGRTPAGQNWLDQYSASHKLRFIVPPGPALPSCAGLE